MRSNASPLDRGAEQLAILRKPASAMPLTLLALDGAVVAELPLAFENAISERCDLQELETVSTALVVAVGPGIIPLGNGGCWEAMRLMEMHADVGLVGGRIVDGNDVVVASCSLTGSDWSPLGALRTDPGPFAIALKPQTALSTPGGFFYCRADLLRQAVAEGEAGVSLADAMVAIASRQGVRIAYSPLIEARLQAAGVEPGERRGVPAAAAGSDAWVRERLALSKRERASTGSTSPDCAAWRSVHSVARSFAGSSPRSTMSIIARRKT